MLAVTLYNRYANPETRQEEWHRTVLTGARVGGGDAVHWEDADGVRIGGHGASLAGNVGDSTSVMIWFTALAEGKRYVPPKRYAALPPEEVARHWTLQEGVTRMVKGDAPETDPKDAIARYDDCITVTGVATMDFGGEAMRHWEVTGH